MSCLRVLRTRHLSHLLFTILFLFLLTACGSSTPTSDLTVTLQPAPEGRNGTFLTINLTDPAGKPVTDASVSLEGNMNHAGMAPVLGDGVKDDADGALDGSYQVPFAFDMAGDWIVAVAIERNGTTETKDINVVVDESDVKVEGADSGQPVVSIAAIQPTASEAVAPTSTDTPIREPTATRPATITATIAVTTSSGDHDNHENSDSSATSEVGSEETSRKVTTNDPTYLSTVAISLHLLNIAGFHEIDVAINETGKLHPEFSDVIGYNLHLVQDIQWPDASTKTADALVVALTQLQAAIMAGDLESAKEPIANVHDEQHDLEHKLALWLRRQKLPVEATPDPFSVATTCFLLQQMNFATIAQNVQAGEINGSDQGSVDGAQRLMASVVWPSTTAEQVDRLLTTLDDLSHAMEHSKLEVANTLSLSTTADIEQFLQTSDGWLAQQSSANDAIDSTHMAIAHRLLDLANFDTITADDDQERRQLSGLCHWASRLIKATRWSAEIEPTALELAEALQALEKNASQNASEIQTQLADVQTEMQALTTFFRHQHGE